MLGCGPQVCRVWRLREPGRSRLAYIAALLPRRPVSPLSGRQCLTRLFLSLSQVSPQRVPTVPGAREGRSLAERPSRASSSLTWGARTRGAASRGRRQPPRSRSETASPPPPCHEIGALAATRLYLLLFFFYFFLSVVHVLLRWRLGCCSAMKCSWSRRPSGWGDSSLRLVSGPWT